MTPKRNKRQRQQRNVIEVFKRESFTNLSSIKIEWETWSWMTALGDVIQGTRNEGHSRQRVKKKERNKVKN